MSLTADSKLSGYLRVLLVLAAGFALGSGCDGSPSRSTLGPDSSTAPTTLAKATIGPTGGTLTSADRIVTLTIPPGALSSSITVTIAPASAAPAGNIGTAYDIKPEGTSFTTPATISFSYGGGAIPAASFNNVSVASSSSAGKWTAQPMTLLDPNREVATTLTTHLSLWAIIPYQGGADGGACTCTGALGTAAQKCCTGNGGASYTNGATCTCCGVPLNTIAQCISETTGGEEIPNFNSSCLAKCCPTDKGYQVNLAGDCEGDSSSWDPVLACAQGCFGSSSQPGWLVCAGPGSDLPKLDCPTPDDDDDDADTDAAPDASADDADEDSAPTPEDDGSGALGESSDDASEGAPSGDGAADVGGHPAAVGFDATPATACTWSDSTGASGTCSLEYYGTICMNIAPLFNPEGLCDIFPTDSIDDSGNPTVSFDDSGVEVPAYDVGVYSTSDLQMCAAVGTDAFRCPGTTTTLTVTSLDGVQPHGTLAIEFVPFDTTSPSACTPSTVQFTVTF